MSSDYSGANENERLLLREEGLEGLQERGELLTPTPPRIADLTLNRALFFAALEP